MENEEKLQERLCDQEENLRELNSFTPFLKWNPKRCPKI